MALLFQSGVQTAPDFQAWIQDRHSYDFRLACAAGPFSQLGYLLGMTLANSVVGGMLPGYVQRNASLFGLALGGGVVGPLDVSTCQLAHKLVQHLAYAAPASEMPEGVVQTGKVEAVMWDAGYATLMNAAKNSARIVLPLIHAQFERRPDGLINRKLSGVLDVALDGGMGLVPGLVDATRKMHKGSDGVPYPPRLLLQPPDQFAQRVNRSRAPQAPLVTAVQSQQPAAAPPSVLNVLPQVMVPLSILGVIMVFVSTLVSRNTNIMADGHRGRDIPEGYADPMVLASKAASSTWEMALMTATITLLVPAFEKAANELVNYARNPRLPTAASLRWPSFLRPQLQLPPIDELSV